MMTGCTRLLLVSLNVAALIHIQVVVFDVGFSLSVLATVGAADPKREAECVIAKLRTESAASSAEEYSL
jgi:hypothetical protein